LPNDFGCCDALLVFKELLTMGEFEKLVAFLARKCNENPELRTQLSFRS